MLLPIFPTKDVTFVITKKKKASFVLVFCFRPSLLHVSEVDYPFIEGLQIYEFNQIMR